MRTPGLSFAGAFEGDLREAAEDIGALLRRDPRWPIISRERMVTGRTLDSIGTELGLTRERVRQLEAALREKLTEIASVRDAMDGLRRAVPAFSHVTEVVEDVPGLAGGIPGVGLALLDIIRALTPEISLVGCGWLVADGADARVDEVLGELSDDAGTVELRAAARTLDVAPDALGDYLATVGERYTFRGHVLNRDRSIGDRALALLSLADGAMTTAQLAELIPGRTRPSIRNALSAEPRIVRSAPDTWALGDRPEARPVNHARPELTAGMHLHRGRWSYLVSVADALTAAEAGTSFELPHAIPALLDAPYDVPVHVPGDGGPHTVRWRRQGAVGTGIGEWLVGKGTTTGRVRVIVGKRIEILDVAETTEHGPWASAYSALGLGNPPADGKDRLPVVAESIGLPREAPYCTIAARLRLRDQHFVADALADAMAGAYTLEP